jgi:hypothetical protein
MKMLPAVKTIINSCSMIWGERWLYVWWYWWNCWSSLFKLSFHIKLQFFKNLHICLLYLCGLKILWNHRFTRFTKYIPVYWYLYFIFLYVFQTDHNLCYSSGEAHFKYLSFIFRTKYVSRQCWTATFTF